ncbi:MAG: flagellar basal body-associated FliL family protein [Oligoflexia bacterium]|nr:flagellar basal body-associated FliL family protein [Oligoflexia bacterium]
MADNNAAKKEDEIETPSAERKPAAEGPKPIMLMALIAVNMLAMIGVIFVLWKAQKAENAKPNLGQLVEGERKHEEDSKSQDKEKKDFLGRLIPMETFLVNLAGTRGNKLVKINMELEVDGEKVEEEIEKRKPQIRDIIIILLSSKTYDQMTNKDGKESLRTEIRDTVNSFLTKGKIKNVYFTDFIVN